MPFIVADTTCGLPHEILEKWGIPVIAQVVMFGDSIPVFSAKAEGFTNPPKDRR